MMKILRKISIKNIFLKKTLSVYFDHASGTPLDSRVEMEMRSAEHSFGNPSGIHSFGIASQKLLTEARARIAQILQVRKNEIVFTSGGTEGNNLVMHGIVSMWRKNNQGKTPHILVSSIEHASVLECVRHMEDVSVTYIPVDANGRVNVTDIKEALTPLTVLVSIQYVNNEIGTIEPLSDIARIIRHHKKAKGSVYPVFHTDACQAGNYLPLVVPKLGIDALTLNGSKIYGPRGTGFIYINQQIPFSPDMYGGDQEYGYRAGTENVPGCVGLSYALLYAQDVHEKESIRVSKLRDFLLTQLVQDSRIHVHGSREHRVANNINIWIDGVLSEEIVIRLDMRGFAVSEKSACKSEDQEISHVIKAISGKEAKGSIRISLGRSTTQKDCIRFVAELKDILRIMKIQ